MGGTLTRGSDILVAETKKGVGCAGYNGTLHEPADLKKVHERKEKKKRKKEQEK